MSDYTRTTNYNLYKPTPDADYDAWGGHINANSDMLDSVIFALSPVGAQDALNVVNVLNHGAKGDGTTDDTAAIQAVLNTYAGKATVFIPQTGNYYRTRQLTLPSYTDLLLYGGLQALSGLTGDYIKTGPANFITIRGTGVIDGNRAAQTAAGAGLGLTQVGDARISGITLQNAFYWNLNVVQSSNVVVDGVTMIGGGAANEFAAGSSNCWLTNCHVDGTNLGDYGFCFYGGVTNSGAIGNIFHNCGVGTTSTPPGVGVLSDSAQPGVCSNIVIADNISHDNGGPGVQVQGAASTHTGILISNNRSYNNNKIGAGGTAGADYWVGGVTDITITGNSISANGNSGGTQFTGIFLNPDASHVSIIGNHIFNIGKTTTTGCGIWSFNTQYVYASGNYIYDNQGTPTMQYSVTGNAGVANAYVGNFFDVAFHLNAVSTTTLANAETGFWKFGATNNSAIDTAVIIRSGANTNRLLTFCTNDLPRFRVGVVGPNETGSNVGSDFNVISCNDGGTSLGTPLSITRSNGLVKFSPYTGSDLSVGLDGPAGKNRLIVCTTNGISRWFFGTNGAAEAGANTGSDFVIVSALDSGALSQTPLRISRSNGVVTLAAAPIITALPTNAANDAAAASAGVPVGGVYRNASALMVRTV